MKKVFALFLFIIFGASNCMEMPVDDMKDNMFTYEDETIDVTEIDVKKMSFQELLRECKKLNENGNKEEATNLLRQYYIKNEGYVPDNKEKKIVGKKVSLKKN